MNNQPFQPKWLWGIVALGGLGMFMGLATAAVLGMASLLGLDLADPLQVALASVASLVPFLPLWMLLGLFFLAPLLRYSGAFQYYSPYLIVTQAGKGRLELHGATPWDYLWLFRWRDRGRSAVRRILLWYVEGLLALARDLEAGRLPGVVSVSATSYLFSRHTAQRFGFAVEERRSLAWGGLLTLPTQVVTYSFARGRWALPPLSKSKRATLSSSDLCAQIPHLERVLRRLRHAEEKEIL